MRIQLFFIFLFFTLSTLWFTPYTRAAVFHLNLRNAPVKGMPDAPVVMVEFSDFECPFCKKFARTTLKQIEEKYIKRGLVKVIFKHFPLFIHPFALLAAQASYCLHLQGKFWEMHDLLIGEDKLDPFKVEKFADRLGLKGDEYDSCVNRQKTLDAINADIKDGKKSGVQGVPAFIIGQETSGQVEGEMIRGAQPFDVFDEVIKKYLRLRSVYFTFSSYDISPEARSIISSHARWLIAHPDVMVILEGHTDLTGPEEFNRWLGKKRAEAVKRALVDLGVDSARIEVVSYGEENPVTRDPSPRAQALNRRVEFRLVPGD